jgi:hypothetical protein
MAPKIRPAMDIVDLSLSETQASLSGACEYNTDVFDAQTIAPMAEKVARPLEGSAANREQRVRWPLLAIVLDEADMAAWR